MTVFVIIDYITDAVIIGNIISSDELVGAVISAGSPSLHMFRMSMYMMNIPRYVPQTVYGLSCRSTSQCLGG